MERDAGKKTQGIGKQGLEDIDPMAYLLFLILILLIIGNSKKFEGYFNLLDKETKEIERALSIFSSTANGVKLLFQNSQGLGEEV